MAAYCLPKAMSSIFIQKIMDGTLNPVELKNLSSEERRAKFGELLGEENAKDVNTLFEQKLLMPNQKKAMVDWARSVAGLNKQAREDIADKIQKMDQVLQPADQKSFLADLANKKLGVAVTSEEAQKIFDMSTDVKNKKADWESDIDNQEKRISYGRSLLDLRDTIEEMKPDGHSLVDKIVNVAAIPKSMLTSIFHFSAPFVQGWGMMSTGRAWEGFGQMMKYFYDEDNYQNFRAYMITHPDYDLARKGGLALTDLSDKLNDREEALQSTLVQKANDYLGQGLPYTNIVGASSRAFTGYLNYVRFNRFADLLNAARNAGEDVREGSSVVSDLAKVVNDFTGRGSIGTGDQFRNTTAVLNTVFFSPRKLSATIAMFNPITYLKPSMSPTARIAAIRQLTGSLLATGAVLGLAVGAGAEVDMNPTSAKFAKIKLGETYLDITGGNSIYLRLLSRIATGSEITSSGKQIQLGEGYRPITRADLVTQYIRGKLSPTAGLLADYLYGHDPIGNEFNITDEIRKDVQPIFLSSLISFFEQTPDNTGAIVPVLSGMFGVGVENALPPLHKLGVTSWGDPVSLWHDPIRSNLDRELTKLGKTMSFPNPTINGVKLTDDQYREYIVASGQSAKMQISSLINSTFWEKASNQTKLDMVNSAIKTGRDLAQSEIMIKSINGPNDILKQSINNQIQKVQAYSQPSGVADIPEQQIGPQ